MVLESGVYWWQQWTDHRSHSPSPCSAWEENVEPGKEAVLICFGGRVFWFVFNICLTSHYLLVINSVNSKSNLFCPCWLSVSDPSLSLSQLMSLSLYFSLPCPVAEDWGRVALVGTWHRPGLTHHSSLPTSCAWAADLFGWRSQPSLLPVVGSLVGIGLSYCVKS